MHTIRVDRQKRVRLPQAKPGQVFSYESKPDGTISLTPVFPKEMKTIVGKLVKQGDALVLKIPDGYTLDPEDIAQAVREERDSR